MSETLELKSTLDEKRAQLQIYRTLLHDALAHQQDIVDLRDRTENLPERNEKIDQQLALLSEQHAKLLKRAQQFVEKYEAIVSDHQQYSKAVMASNEWMDATHNAVLMWGDTDLEKISLLSNLERLKNLQASLPEEYSRIAIIQDLGDKVIPGTIAHGQQNIRSQIESSQQEWAGLLSVVSNTIQALQSKLEQWSEYEQSKEKCLTWIRNTDTKLHSIDLKPTLQEKNKQLEELKNLQGEVRAKELEIDAVTEQAQLLNKSLSNRSSQVSELGVKYQQVCHKVKELTSRWQQYVNSHEDFDSQVTQCEQWLDDIKNKLSYCSDLNSSSQQDLEAKLAIIQDLMLCKEDGFAKIQNLVELAQSVLANTAPSGHKAINDVLTNLQEDWSNVASKMVETKTSLDDLLTKWAGLLQQTQGLNKTIEWMENQLQELSVFQSSIPEKRVQLDRIKSVEEKVRCEKIEVDNLKAKASEMLSSGQQGQSAIQAQAILDKFDDLAQKIKVKVTNIYKPKYLLIFFCFTESPYRQRKSVQGS